MDFFNGWMSPSELGVHRSEFHDHFYETGFEQSQSSKDVIEALNFEELNEKFKKENIPYMAFVESERTKMHLVGKSYFFVRPEQGVIDSGDSANSKMIEGKDHVRLAKVKDSNDEMLIEIKDFIRAHLV